MSPQKANMMLNTFFKLLFILAFGSLSCGPGLLEGEEISDSDETVSTDLLTAFSTQPTDTDEEMHLCPANTEVDCRENMAIGSDLFPAISASWVNENAIFSHFAIDVILGYQTINNETFPFALQVKFEEVFTHTYFNQNAEVHILDEDEPSAMEWLGVFVKSTGILHTDVQSMAAATDGNRYFLVNVSESPMTILPETELITAAVLTDAVYLRNKADFNSPELERVCLFGEGLFCYDGESWVTEISPDEGFMVLNIAVSNINEKPMVFAVGDNNIIFSKYDNIWSTVQLNETDAPLHEITINSSSQYFAAAGDQFLLFGAADRPIQRCDVPPHILRLNYFYGTETFALLDTKGQIWTGVLDLFNNGELCRTRNRVEGAIDALPSGIDYYVLHPEGLYRPDNSYWEIVAE
ncbi:MAG: hypothetical protein JXX29_13645 [Deltaproteobacteria bacterium]|nr:hypothetical protein [Deltaproteobacteria bacterium]MBN2672723.1 hypothetical protein [Deltaproteobacteria bacterium]